MANTPKVMVRFEAGARDAQSIEYGPFEYVQLTYGGLDVGDGHLLAAQPEGSSEWCVATPEEFEQGKPPQLTHVTINPDDGGQRFTDVVIFASK